MLIRPLKLLAMILLLFLMRFSAKRSHVSSFFPILLIIIVIFSFHKEQNKNINDRIEYSIRHWSYVHSQSEEMFYPQGS